MCKRFLSFFLAFVCLYGQEALTNESISKLVKAGLAEDVISGMIANQPGNYSTGAAAVIALKQAGVSDKIITAIVAKGARPSASANVEAQPAIAEFVVHDATPVRLRLSRNLSSADAKAGTPSISKSLRT